MGSFQLPPSEIQMGNGKFLVTFDSIGEIEQIFAPNIDSLQSKIGNYQTLVLLPPDEFSYGNPVLIPLNHDQFNVRFQLEKGSQILQIEYQHKHRSLQLLRTLCLHPTDPILLDQWKLPKENVGLLHASIPWIGYSTTAHCSLFHPYFNGIVHHRGRRWLGVIASLGNPVWEKVSHLSDPERSRLWSGERISVPLHGGDLAGFPHGQISKGWDHVAQGCATWGAMAIGPTEDVAFFIICAESESHLGQMVEQMRHLPSRRFIQLIAGMVQNRYLPASKLLSQIDNSQVKHLCERSIDVLHALQDAETGALMAAAEVDPHSQISGGYGYSWPRDGAYLATALGAFGYHDRAQQYFRFLTDTQDQSGTWWQRYLATGHAGPSWGRIQIDEPATVIAAAFLHFKRTRDFLWLEGIWPTLKNGLRFLEEFHSEGEQLGSPSFDLWEERQGIHAYSLAAVSAAFTTGALLAGELMETDLQTKYSELGERMATRIIEKFVPENGTIHRSHVIGRWGENYWDQTTDVSMLGLILPFRILPKRHPTAQKILESIRSKLWNAPTGGTCRYEKDHYRGGNPWILCTLWLASVELSLENYTEAREAFQWVLTKSTSLGFLPEQVHKETGMPYWVIPLAWSHAMFLLFVHNVIHKKLERQIWEKL